MAGTSGKLSSPWSSLRSRYWLATLRVAWRIPRSLAIGVVLLYQKTLSPDHGFLTALFPGGYCRFTPSCSDYCKESFKKNGFLYGFVKSFWRILRCNPW
ncbi:membrane protein insertion efficiency factor YidD, partial [Candidatus Peregrinibacteria bacterium]|nr:membrane protein insertion efficiency factor YidD [Candidatus Peregrinibacteria bacterium]